MNNEIDNVTSTKKRAKRHPEDILQQPKVTSINTADDHLIEASLWRKIVI